MVTGGAEVFSTGVEDPDTVPVPVPGGRPRFLAGGCPLPLSSIFLLLFKMTGLAAGFSGLALTLLVSCPALSVSAPDLDVWEVVSSSEELEELSESELSDSELLDSILFIFFLT